MYSAGVLIYFIQDGEINFLLGKDAYGTWSDFGGKADLLDNNDPTMTASRECYEETSGVICSRARIHHELQTHTGPFICSSYKRHRYYMYLVRLDVIELVDVRARFDNMRRLLGAYEGLERFKEKTSLSVFNTDQIMENPSHFRSVFYTSFINNVDSIRGCVLI